MEIRLLGPVEAVEKDQALPLPRPKQRALLAALALRAGEAVPVERLLGALWGETPPATAVGSLQNLVSQLRRVLGADTIVRHAHGYSLACPARAGRRLGVRAARCRRAAP